MGIWLAWVMFFTMFYIVMWAANDYATIADKYQVFLIILGVFHVIMLAVWLRLAVLYPSDPGTITSFHDDIDGLLEDATRGIPLDPVTHCRTCLVLKPMRSKHCNKCGVCIARLDHHCTWINRCVGYGNHRIFVVFLLLHVTVLLGYVSLALIVSYEQIRIMHDERVEEYAVRSNSTSIDVTSTSMSSLDVWIEIPGLISGYLIVLIVLIWAMLAAGALGLMAKQHIGNMFTNLTVNEQINWRRYSYLTKQTNGPFSKPVTSKSIVLSNPFDRSAMHNLKEFWTRSGRDAVDYRKVFSAPTEKGFATVPEAHRAESKEVHFSGVQAV
jgi:palmitoyltransferase